MLSRLLKQLVDGEDFHSAAQLVTDLTPDLAIAVPEGGPYSVGTQVNHVVYWQELWLALIEGREPPRKPRSDPDFLPISAEEWPAYVERLLSGERHALELAGRPDLERPLGLEWDPTAAAADLLMEIALHNAYHLGQIALIRQALGAWPPASPAQA